jgi:hypothetical protein
MIRLYINNASIDLKEDIPFPVTYSIADVKEPSKRKRDMSKTVTLPGTQRNRQFFASAYNITISDVLQDGIGFSFDPTLRYPAFALRNGKPVFHGFATLTDVRINNEIPEFDIVCFSTVIDLFTALGDMTLSELGWSAYDHVLSVANISATWTAAQGSGVWYPLVDYGYTDDLLSYKTNELILNVYWKEVIEKCLAINNLTLLSTHMNTTLFKRHTVGRGGGAITTITAAQVNDRHVEYTGDGSTPFSIDGSVFGFLGSSTIWNDFRIIPISDNALLTLTLVDDTLVQFDESNGYLDIANSGKYRLHVNGNLTLYYDFSAPLTDEFIHINLKCRSQLNGINGQWYEQDIYASAGGNTAIPLDLLIDYDLNANDELFVYFALSSHATCLGNEVGETLDITLDFNNDLTYELSAINAEVIDGDTIYVGSQLPNIKAVDFFNDVILLHNLYVSEPNDDGEVKIEPITSYYRETNDTDNWTDKLDKKKEIKITPSINLAEGAQYYFGFAEDRDAYKLDYFNNHGIDYGDMLFTVPGNFKKGRKEFRAKTMAQSVPVQLDGVDIIIPRIVTLNATTGFSSPYNGKARCFLNNGNISCDSWNLVNSDTLVATVKTTYPRAHHLDSLSSATYDLNWAVPIDVYYTLTTYTTSNLYARFYQAFIREIASRDGKLLTAYFKLDEGDLYTDFMRRLVNISGSVYRKNAIKDFDITNNKTVLCELIKVVQGRNRRTFIPSLPITSPPQPGSTETITTSTAVTSKQKSYVIDTTGGDITMTFDTTTSTYKEGSKWDFVKIGGNDLIFVIVGGETLSGDTTVTVSRDYDAPNIIYKEGEFYFN